MNYKSPPKRQHFGPITTREMTEFVAEYIRFDQLGEIDNAHKAQADSLEGGWKRHFALRWQSFTR